MRRSLLALFACLTVFLIAASAPFSVVPTVVVYPLLASASAVDANAITQIETLLATHIGQGGKVKIVQPTAGVDRQKFLADARSLGADYYVTGFITPLGDGASVIDQVVSTQSGTVVFSVQTQITTYAEVGDQGDQLREGILARSSRGIAAFQAPPPEAAPKPTASNGTSVNVGLGGKARGAASGAATPLPADATIAILAVGGSADPDQRAAAAQALAASFGHDGRHAIVVTAAAPSNDVCVANNASALVAAWLETQTGSADAATASLRLIEYDCSGKIAFDHSFQSREGLTGVADAAVAALIKSR